MMRNMNADLVSFWGKWQKFAKKAEGANKIFNSLIIIIIFVLYCLVSFK